VTGSILAELFVLRKRAATWILLGIWAALAATFAYIVPYVMLRNGARDAEAQLSDLLPAQLAGNLSAGFPFYGGALALMLGVLTIGSEFGWGTFKTLFTQRPSRLRVFAAKLIALAVALVPFVVVPFIIAVVSSAFIAQQESAAADWPSVTTFAHALASDWLIMAVWASLGVLLAMLTRGTALAIGIGVLYTLVIEGLLSALARAIDLLDPLVEFFVRANSYSLIEPFGGTLAASSDNGPGSFSGPFVGSAQALVMLCAYAVLFLGLSALLLHRRDVA
jgi:ABC-type transport system involved in multi-copper enzyme maturation permease subunit